MGPNLTLLIFFSLPIFAGDTSSLLTERLSAGEAGYRLMYQGRIIGCLDYETEFKDNQWLRKSLLGRGLNIKEQSNLSLSESLQTLHIDRTGNFNQDRLHIRIKREAGHLKGQINAPRPMGGAGTHQTLELETSSNVPERETFLFWLIQALDFDEQFEEKIDVFDSYSGKIVGLRLKVLEKETIQTPVGVKDTWKVLVEDRKMKIIVHVTTSKPFMVVKLVEGPVTYERVPEGFVSLARQWAQEQEREK